MIKKPQGYDEAAAYTGESQQLPKGKYECVIKQVAGTGGLHKAVKNVPDSLPWATLHGSP